MNRRQFLKLIGVSTSTAALSVFGTWRLSKAPRAKTLQTQVAGAPYYIGHGTAPGEVFFDGQSLRPVREPANPHDANAIALYAGDKKVGFVPRASNVEIAKAMDAGMPAKVQVQYVDEEDAWQGIGLVIDWLEA